ncbi:MAG: type II/IV secretion system protein [Bacilli bacterium]|nr:type II/IV secretion system protein [Bacilli bacterium]
MVEYDFAKVPIVDIVNQIILYAAQHKASDIHFDPLEDALMIRMRFDGDLHNHSLVPKVYERNLITRIKLVSAMNITETRLPQDGAIKGRIGGRDLDMRVSILPTNEGEKCVIRILDFQKGLSGLESLGFSPKNFKKIEKMLAVPNGIILVTGATGSGKSTTTYSMLQALNKEETNIITVEDPIEMNIEGVNQVQVNSEIGMTFAAALRSILRQDPNIILIGEMRDEETAQIAVRASITGHLVLSTIHTNNSLATIERLIDMGVERYMIATSVTGIISQKLARTLCPKCKRLRRTTKYERHMFARVLHKKVKEIYEPVGCDECFKGFTGRIALHEVLYISERLRDKISDESVDKEQLREEVYAREDTTTLLQDALEKVLLGYTTFQEIYRVVDIDVDLDNEIRSDIGMEGVDEFGFDDDNAEDIDWNNFDDVFDDEIDIIDVDVKDENDLPTLNTDIIIHDRIFKQFNKDLDHSDPNFLNFLFRENKALREEEEQAIKAEQEEMEINMRASKYMLSNFMENAKEEITDIIGETPKEEIDENETLELIPNNSLDNVLGGQADDDLTNNKYYLDLSNTEFNYKELLDLIDAYSNDGPSIKDIVDETIKTKRKKELEEEIERDKEKNIPIE